MLARRLTMQRAAAKTRLRFKPHSFQQMAGLAVYYNNHPVSLSLSNLR